MTENNRSDADAANAVITADNSYKALAKLPQGVIQYRAADVTVPSRTDPRGLYDNRQGGGHITRLLDHSAVLLMRAELSNPAQGSRTTSSSGGSGPPM